MHTHQQLLDHIAELKAVNKDLAEQKASLERQQAEHNAERLTFMANFDRQQAEHREARARLIHQAENPSLHVCKVRVIEELMRHKHELDSGVPLQRVRYDEDKVWERLLALVEDDDSDAWDYERKYRVRMVVHHELFIDVEASSKEQAEEQAVNVAESAWLQLSGNHVEWNTEDTSVEVQYSQVID